MILRSISIALVALALSGKASAVACSQQDAAAAETAAASLNSWPNIRAFYQRHRNCDDGAIAEGLTESVMKMLAQDWPSTSLLFQLIGSDPAFKAFVLSHINASGAESDLAAIELNASGRCPALHRGLCKQLLQATTAARADLDSSATELKSQKPHASAPRP